MHIYLINFVFSLNKYEINTQSNLRTENVLKAGVKIISSTF
jgi:hypothetical protein